MHPDKKLDSISVFNSYYNIKNIVQLFVILNFRITIYIYWNRLEYSKSLNHSSLNQSKCSPSDYNIIFYSLLKLKDKAGIFRFYAKQQKCIEYLKGYHPPPTCLHS